MILVKIWKRCLQEFKGKVLFVTGAASGMGRAVAVRFGSLGCKVAVAARRPDAGEETVRLVKEAGGEAIFVSCDVSSDESVKAAIDTTVATFGSLDYAFNNAGCGADGVHIPFVPLTEVTEGDWAKAGVIAITQTAAVENAKAGIRVNVICPGPTDGTNLMADSVAAGSQDTDFLVSHVIPMGKLGTTQDVADSVVYLCSNMSGHVTGMALPVCGGMQM